MLRMSMSDRAYSKIFRLRALLRMWRLVLPAACPRERFVDPRDVLQRHGVGAHPNVDADREAAPPPDPSLRAPGRGGKVELRDIGKDGVAELSHHAAHLTKRERRLELLDAERADHELLSELVAVRVRDSNVRKKSRSVGPAIRMDVPVGRTSDLAFRIREVPADRAVALCAPQGIIRRPRAREDELPVVHAHRVQDDVVAEAASGHIRRWPVLPENALEVPVTSLVLPQPNHRMLDADVPEQQAPIHEVARIVVDRDAPRAHEQAVFGVPNRERVEREAGQQPAANPADVDLAVYPASDLLLDDRPDLLASRVRTDADAQRHDRDEDDRDERKGADEDDEVATLHDLEIGTDRECKGEALKEARSPWRRVRPTGTRSGLRELAHWHLSGT